MGPGLHQRFRAMTGLALLPDQPAAAFRAVLLSIIGVTAFIGLLDGLMFGPHLPESYRATFGTAPWFRTAELCALAAVEEFKFRLIVMTVLAAVAVRLQGRLTLPAVVAIIVAAQFANVGVLVVADPLYAGLRYWLVGCVWGWLYWRHGWLAAVAGHVLTHPVLDPVLYLVLTGTR